MSTTPITGPTLADAMATACASVGIVARDVPQDNAWHHTDIEGDPKGRGDARIKLYPDGEGGLVANWKGDIRLFFVDKGTTLTPEEMSERRRRQSEAMQKAQDEEKRRHAAAANTAKKLWKACGKVNPGHTYLKKKGVASTDTMREIDASKLPSIIGYDPQSGGEKLQGRVLIVPVMVAGEFSTVEMIDQDGRKAALAGGRKKGGYWSTGSLPQGDGEGASLLIAEGVATALSCHEATGQTVLAALSCGNLPVLARIMREYFPKASITICGDIGAGQQHAEEAARSIGGKLALPVFGPDDPAGMSDMNDLHQLRGLEAVRAIINGAAGTAAPPSAMEREESKEAHVYEQVQRLAALSPCQYDQERKTVAKLLDVRPGTLDSLVKEARREKETVAGIVFDDVDPWPEPVDPAKLLSDIAATVRRFIICPYETAVAVALWAAMTWLIDVVQVAPLAVITAPEKRCGKSQLLFLLGRLVARPLTASNISAAAFFRTIDKHQPTLLVDEADSFMKENEELRGVINSGHTRDGAYIIRVVGDEHEPRRFSTWAAKAVAGIGKLADTLMDRAVVLQLRRKLPHENIERLRQAETELFPTLAAKLHRFANDCREEIRCARPALPAQLNDRAQDNWEPLLAIADAAGGQWPKIAREAALKLSGDSSSMTIGVELLADILEVFKTKQVDRISTVELIAALCDDEEKRWSTHNRGNQINPRQVAKRLADYEIKSNTIRIGFSTPKGYMLEQFSEAFSRYLAVPPLPSATPPQPALDKEKHVADSVFVTVTDYQKATPKPALDKGCGGVADKIGGRGGKENFSTTI